MRWSVLFIIPALFSAAAALGASHAQADAYYSVEKKDVLSRILYKHAKQLGMKRFKLYGKNGLVRKTLALNPNINQANLIFPKMKIRLPGIFAQAAQARLAEAKLELAPTLIPEPKVEREPAAVEPVVSVIEEKPLEPSELDATPIGLSFGVGYSAQSYTETFIEPYEQGAITLKAGIQRALSAHWSYAGSGYFTVASLSKNREDVTAKFLGLNARLGYYVPGLGDNWALSFWGGAYYATMQVAAEDPLKLFGFINQSGPQAFVILKRALGPKFFLSGYLKFSPIMGSVTDLSLSDSEKATGLSLGWKVSGSKTILFSCDIARLTLQILDRQLESNSTSFSLGFAF